MGWGSYAPRKVPQSVILAGRAASTLKSGHTVTSCWKKLRHKLLGPKALGSPLLIQPIRAESRQSQTNALPMRILPHTMGPAGTMGPACRWGGGAVPRSPGLTSEPGGAFRGCSPSPPHPLLSSPSSTHLPSLPTSPQNKSGKKPGGRPVEQVGEDQVWASWPAPNTITGCLGPVNYGPP